MDFLSYAKSLNPTILSLPITGCLTPYDTYQRAVSVSGNPKWLKKNNRFGFHPNESGYYVVTNDTEHQITSFSLFVFFGEPLYYSGVGYSKIMIDCSNFWRFGLYENGGAQRIYVRDQVGTNTRYLTSDWSGKISVGVSVTNNQLASFYYDGVYAGPSNSTVPITASTQDITIGANSLAAAFIDKPIQFAAMFPGEITFENFSYLHNEASKMQIVPHKIKTHYVPTQINSPKVSISGPPNANRIIPDKSGNNHHATVSGNLSISSDNFDSLYNFRGEGVGMGAGVITVPNNSDIEDMSSFTYVIDLNKIRSTGESGAGRIIFKNYHLRYMGGNVIRYTQIYSGGAETWDISPIPEDSIGRLTFSHNRASPSTLPTAQLNGVDLNVASVATTTGTPNSDSAHNLQIGNYNGIRQVDAIITGVNAYDKLLSTDEKRVEYLDCTLNHVIKYTNRFEHPVTLSSVSAPSKVGPWNITYANSAQYLDDGNSRYIFHNDINCAASQLLSHYTGAYYVKYKIHTISDYRFLPLALCSVSQVPALGSSGGQYSYQFFHNHKFNRRLQIYRYDNGGAPVLIAQSDANWISNEIQTLELFITRRATDQYFKLYARDNNHPTWSLACEGADTTYTSELKFIMNHTYGDAGSQMSVYETWSWPYGDSLLPTDVPELADY